MSLERIVRRSQGKNVAPKSRQISTPNETSAKTLQESLDKYLAQRNRPYKRQTNAFSPSYTQTCKRWWYLIFDGADSVPKIEPRVHRIFDTGHSMHERYNDYFKAMGILVATEVEFFIKHPVPMKGRADGIINWGGNKLFELKSMGTEGFQYRKLFKKPKDDHYAQAQLYLYALKLDEGFVIYEDKSNQDNLFFPIERDDVVLDKLFKRYKKWYTNIEKRELPVRPYARNSKQCQSCDLLDYCWDTLDD